MYYDIQSIWIIIIIRIIIFIIIIIIIIIIERNANGRHVLGKVCKRWKSEKLQACKRKRKEEREKPPKVNRSKWSRK